MAAPDAAVAVPPPEPPTESQEAVKSAAGADQEENWRLQAQAQALREDQVQNAVNFLSHPKVKGSPVQYRRAFLEKKGLTKEEIDEAFRRVPDAPFSATAASPSSKEAPATQPALPVAASVPNQTLALASPQQGAIRWTTLVLALGLLASAGAGTGVVFKKWLFPKFKKWVRQVALDDGSDKSEEKRDDQENGSALSAVSTAAAVAALAAAASEVAAATQESIRSRAEDRDARHLFIQAVEAQTKEVKIAVSGLQEAMQVLDVSRRNSSVPHDLGGTGRSMTGPETFNWTNQPAPTNTWEAQYAARNSILKSSRSGLATEVQKSSSNYGPSANSTSQPDFPLHAPHSHSYQEIFAMVERGETPPGIRAVNDKPPNPKQPPSYPQLAPRQKPWEAVAPGGTQSSDSTASVEETARVLVEKTSLGNGAHVDSSALRHDAGSSPNLWWRQPKGDYGKKSLLNEGFTRTTGGSSSGNGGDALVNGSGFGKGTQFGVNGSSSEYSSHSNTGSVAQKWVPPPIPKPILPGVAPSIWPQGRGSDDGGVSAGNPSSDVKQESVEEPPESDSQSGGISQNAEFVDTRLDARLGDVEETTGLRDMRDA